MALLRGNKIKGVTIEIGADTDAFIKAIKTLESSLKLTENSLKDINKLLKLDPTNITLYKQKQDDLNKSIDNYKKTLAELKSARDKATDPAQIAALSKAITETEVRLKDTEKQVRELGSAFGQAMQAVGGKITDAGNKIADVGQSMTTKFTVPILGAFTGSVNAAKNWESAWIGVTKTVEFESKAQSDAIEQQLKDLSQSTASSMTDIAKVAEISGQLGVETDNLVDFTEVMIKLGDTTDLSSEQAATALARILNITGESFDSIENLGSVVVELGNNYATTESEILDMTNRIAAAGSVAGLSTTEMMALATAASSLGVKSEAGGTAFVQTFASITKAINGVGENADIKLNKMAQISGMTADQFSKAWSERPMEVLQAFFKGLGDLEANSENLTVVLDELDMSGVRQANMVSALAESGDLLTNAVNDANKAYAENSALSIEAEKRYGSFEAKLTQLKSRLEELGITFGEIIIPVLDKVIEFLSPIIDYLTNLDEETKNNIITILAVVAAIGPVLLIGGKLIAFIGGVITKIGTLVSFVQGSLIPLIAAHGPIMLAVAAIIAIGVLLYKNWDKIIEWAKKLWENIKETWSNIKNFIGESWQAIKDDTKQKLENLKQIAINLVTGISKGLNEGWEDTKQKAAEKWESIKQTISDKIQATKDFVSNMIERIKSLFNFSWELPRPKIPKIVWDWQSVGGFLSIPTFHIEWFKKAKNQPYMFNSPQIIGVGDVPEVVVGADKFKQMTQGNNNITNNITINAEINSDEDIRVLSNRIGDSIQQAVDRRLAVWR